MFTKKERLTKKEFDHSFSVGTRHHCPSLQLIHHPSDSFHGAAVVGKKVYKKAVDRNRLRRQMYGVLYRHHTASALTGTFILIAKPAIKKMNTSELSAEIQTLVGKV